MDTKVLYHNYSVVFPSAVPPMTFAHESTHRNINSPAADAVSGTTLLHLATVQL